MTKDLRDAVTAMNELPDISHGDSERLRGFTRMTAVEIKAVGGVGAATSLEMIGYIRELEQKLRSRAPVVASRGDATGRKLTPPELNHLSALLEAERESGSYAGPREQYYARTERLIKWCNDQTGEK